MVCAQKNHRGLDALFASSVILHCIVLLLFAETGWNPESTPPGARAQGLVNVDWVAEWFFDKNVNLIVSPATAWMLGGLNVKVLFSPTKIE